VKAFNTSVRQLLKAYFANKREQVDQETVLTSLFEAYLSCKDSEFMAYIKRKKQEHVDNTVVYTTKQLMDQDHEQYQTMVYEKLGELSQ
jgi:hypothetical protein